MDTIYYVSGTLMTIIFFALIIVTIFLLIKPHVLNNRMKKPLSRGKIFAIGLATLFVSLFGFGSVMAATEPASVKAERFAREAAAIKAEQAKKIAEEKAKAADEKRKREEEAKKPVVKTETKLEPVPFTATEQPDGSLPKGQTRVAVEGVNGERTITVEVTTVQGKETARKEVKSEITKAPVAKVIHVGTYVAPAPAPAPKPQPQASVYYKNCTAARAAGAAPVYAGEPGYARHLDRDGDGIGCE